METNSYTIISIVTLVLIVGYLIIVREKSTNTKTPSNFGIFAVASMIVGIILGYNDQRGWGYAFIAHGALAMVIGAIRLFRKKSAKEA